MARGKSSRNRRWRPLNGNECGTVGTKKNTDDGVEDVGADECSERTSTRVEVEAQGEKIAEMKMQMAELRSDMLKKLGKVSASVQDVKERFEKTKEELKFVQKKQNSALEQSAKPPVTGSLLRGLSSCPPCPMPTGRTISRCPLGCVGCAMRRRWALSQMWSLQASWAQWQPSAWEFPNASQEFTPESQAPEWQSNAWESPNVLQQLTPDRQAYEWQPSAWESPSASWEHVPQYNAGTQSLLQGTTDEGPCELYSESLPNASLHTTVPTEIHEEQAGSPESGRDQAPGVVSEIVGGGERDGAEGVEAAAGSELWEWLMPAEVAGDESPVLTEDDTLKFEFELAGIRGLDFDEESSMSGDEAQLPTNQLTPPLPARLARSRYNKISNMQHRAFQ